MPCERAPVISKPALVQRLLGAEQDQPAEDNGLVGFAAPLSMEFVSQLGPVISCNLVFKHHGEPARYGTHLKQHRMPARASKTFCFCRGRCAQHRELRVDAPLLCSIAFFSSIKLQSQGEDILPLLRSKSCKAKQMLIPSSCSPRSGRPLCEAARRSIGVSQLQDYLFQTLERIRKGFSWRGDGGPMFREEALPVPGPMSHSLEDRAVDA